MKCVEFKEQNVVFGKGHPEYLPLPAHKFRNSSSGQMVCCWGMSWKERLTVMFTGKIWHQVLTFHDPLQPQMLQVRKPDMN